MIGLNNSTDVGNLFVLRSGGAHSSDQNRKELAFDALRAVNPDLGRVQPERRYRPRVRGSNNYYYVRYTCMVV